MKKKAETIKKDHAAVVLEGLRSDFKVFGESLSAVREKGEATFKAVGRLQEDVSVLKSDIQMVKEELHLIRNELKEKVSRDEFVFLESRVTKLEKLARS